MRRYGNRLPKLKGSYKLSLADAVGLALTLKVGGEFITSDHHELDPLAAAGVRPDQLLSLMSDESRGELDRWLRLCLKIA